MLLFFVLAYVAELIFFTEVHWVKYLGFLPLGASIYLAVSDKENFDPEGSTFWIVVALGLVAVLLPLIAKVTIANIIS